MGHLLVVTPLRGEFEALVNTLVAVDGLGQERSIGEIPIRIFSELGVIVALGGHGKVQFALHVQCLLGHIANVCLVVCAGVAGGLAKGISVGDIVVALETVEHDYKLRFDNEPSPRFSGNSEALSFLKREQHVLESGFCIHFGIIASGDEDVVSPVRANELQQETGAVAVAWEGAGGARASKFCGKPYLEVRGLTDIADSQAPCDFEKNLSRAMRNVGCVLILLASKLKKEGDLISVCH